MRSSWILAVLALFLDVHMLQRVISHEMLARSTWRLYLFEPLQPF